MSLRALIAIVFVSSTVVAQTPRLLTDLNTTPFNGRGSGAAGLVATSAFVGFVATSPNAGTEVFRTDGTRAMTTVLDIIPGAAGVGPTAITPFGARLLISASSGDLWITDGTPAGTTQIAAALYGAQFFVVGSTVLFEGGPSNDRELWRTDGTASGTYRVHDFAPGGSGRPRVLGTHLGKAYLAATDSALDSELWVTDGTSAGTTRVTNLVPRLAGGPAAFVSLGANSGFLVAFVVGTRYTIYRGNGSQIAPLASYTSQPGAIDAFVPWNGRVYFAARDLSGPTLWSSDGTDTGTAPVANAPTGVGHLTATPLGLFFSARDGIAGDELHRLDASGVITRLTDVRPGPTPSYPQSPVHYSGQIYFTAETTKDSRALFVTDGTVAGTRMLRSFPANAPGVLELVAGRRKLVLAVDDGIVGREPWTSDGTTAGTTLLVDIDPTSLPGTRGSGARHLTDFNGTLLFVGSDGIHGDELWRSDGTPNGTRRLTDIAPGAESADPSRLTVARNRLFFVNAGHELWVTDGTITGTRLVRTFAKPMSCAHLTAFDRDLYFTVYGDPVNGVELWFSDGTPAGTRLVRDIVPGPGGAQPLELTRFGSRLLFTADDRVSGRELWITDGTAAGTTLLADIEPGPGSSHPEQLTVWRGRVYFFATDGLVGTEPRVTDGTTAGTRVLRDTAVLTPGPLRGPQNVAFIRSGTRLFFRLVTFTPAIVHNFWTTDGTRTGTRVVASTSDVVTASPAAGDKLFVAHNGGRSVTVVDASAGPVVIPTPTMPSGSFTVRVGATPAGSRRSWFVAQGPADVEPFRTDGTTMTGLDLNPGTSPSGPTPPVVSGGRVFTRAYEPTNHAELWILDESASARRVGAGSNPAGNAPELAVTDPIVGRAVRITIANAFPGSIATVWFNWGFAQPYAIAPGAFSYVNPVGITRIATMRVDGTGSATLAFHLPNATALKGLTATVQAHMTPSPHSGVELTNAVHLRFGD